MSPHVSPPASALHPRLLTLEIRGGYLDALCLSLAPHTTCIIGGKGSGKTTAFELLRFALGAPSLAAKETVRSLLKKNLGSGVVRVTFETKHGVRYVAERGIADERPRYSTPEGEPVKLAADVFPVEAYGQDEIRARRREPRLAARARRSARGGRAQAVRRGDRDGHAAPRRRRAGAPRARSGDHRARERRRRGARDRRAAQAAPRRHRARAQLVAKAHEAKGLRGREKQAMGAVPGALGEVRAGVDAVATSLRKKLAALVPAEASRGPNAALFATVLQEVAAVSGVLESFARETAMRVDAANVVLEGTRDRLAAAHAEQDLAYDALLARQKEDQARVDERTRLQERHAIVAGAVPLLEERTRTFARLRAEEDTLAARLVELRELRSGARTRVKKEHEERLLADGVRIRVEEDQQLDAYKALLREVFAPITGNQPKWLVDKITARLRPTSSSRSCARRTSRASSSARS